MKSGDQFVIEDGPSFVSPNGSFENSNLVNNDLTAVMGVLDTNRNLLEEKNIINELRAVNEKQDRQAQQTREMFMNAI